MAEFQKALEHTLIWEGGYQRSSRDSGNYNSRRELIGTNYGISAPVLEAYMGRVPTVEDMRSLSMSVVNEIYRQYWDEVRASDVEDQAVAGLLFDMAVNHGPRSASRLVQHLVGVKTDGIIGPVSIKAINESDPEDLLRRMVESRRSLYASIVARRPEALVFAKGWERRALSFLPDDNEDKTA